MKEMTSIDIRAQRRRYPISDAAIARMAPQETHEAAQSNGMLVKECRYEKECNYGEERDACESSF